MIKGLLLLLITVSVYATTVKFKYNENVNLIRFMFTISDYNAGSELLKTIYRRKRGSKDKQQIETLKEIINSVPDNIDLYPFDQNIPKDDRRWKTRMEILTFFAAVSKNTNDLKTSLYSVYPNKSAYKLSEMIDYFLPVYKEVYYNHKSRKEIKKLMKYLEKVDSRTQKFFQMEKNFYNSKINIPEINIFIFPLFTDKKDEDYIRKNHLKITKSNSFNTIQVIELVSPFNQNTSFYGIVLHEIAHFCYASSDLIPEFLSEMQKDDKRYGYFAANYLNEALATAMGNGYFIKKTKLKSKKHWYHDPVIDKYAHKLYPLIKNMLDNNKNLKIEQTKKFVEIFKANFPDILTRKETVFNPLNIISTEDFDYKYLAGEIRKYVTITKASAYSPLDDKEAIKSYHQKNKVTQIFILKYDNVNQLKNYNEVNLKQIKKENKAFLKVTFNKKNDRFELFFILKNFNDYKKLLLKIMEKDRITEEIIYL